MIHRGVSAIAALTATARSCRARKLPSVRSANIDTYSSSKSSRENGSPEKRTSTSSVSIRKSTRGAPFSAAAATRMST